MTPALVLLLVLAVSPAPEYASDYDGDTCAETDAGCGSEAPRADAASDAAH